MKKARLVLDNGVSFKGYVPAGQEQTCSGEVVFSTGMVGYCESLTDPSYAGQILTFTYPLIGNYGVPPQDLWESTKIHAKGVIVSEACEEWSHSQGTQSLFEWLRSQNVPIICGVDTRALTKLLREEGTILGGFGTDEEQLKSMAHPHEEHLVDQVSPSEEKVYNEEGLHTIIAVDCGMKENIVRNLERLPLRIKRVRHDYDYTQEKFDGVFYSNGPGDPSKCVEAVEILKKALSIGKPVFGICLGTQLMALAAGAKTFKLRFGHRGHNQPCMHLASRRCYVTSQNHGYAIDPESLPEDWEVTFKNLNDDSVEGIAHKFLPFSAVQFHPEAAPGPTDTMWLFDQFCRRVLDHA